MLDGDTLSNVLHIDLTHKKFWIDSRAELFAGGIGGTGAGIRVLMEECRPDAGGALDEGPIVLAVGPLSGL